MKMKKMALLKLVLIGLVCFNIAGCGDENMLEGMADKDSDAAKREEVRIAMDNGDYALAIEVLEAQYAAYPDDSEIKLELANAYMGNAGFNMLDLVENADALTSPDATTNDFTAVSALLSEQSSENLADMTKAVELLSSIEEPTPDQNLQLAVASLSSVVLAVGTAVEESPVTTGEVIFNETSGQAEYLSGEPVDLAVDDIIAILEQTILEIELLDSATDTLQIGDTTLTSNSTVTELIIANMTASVLAAGDVALDSFDDSTGLSEDSDIETQIIQLQTDLAGGAAGADPTTASIAAYLDSEIF